MRNLFTKVAMIVLLIGTLSTILPVVASAHATQPTQVTHPATACYWTNANRQFGYMHVYLQFVKCYDGTHAWLGSGVHCWDVMSYPWLMSSQNISWCGAWNSGGSYMDGGVNFSYNVRAPIIGGFVSYDSSGYFRLRVYNRGGEYVFGDASMNISWHIM